MMKSDPFPRHEYARRLERRQHEVAKAAQQHLRLANARLVAFLAAVALAFAGPRALGISMAWAIAPAALFFALLLLHARLLARKANAEALVAFYKAALDRLDGLWPGQGLRGEEFVPPDHPYARDLDLFGEGSLYERLCAARTRSGEHALATWLCESAAPDVIRQRQEAVIELRAKLDLREDLALYGSQVRAAVHPRTLGEWATAPPVLAWRRLWWLAGVCAAVAIAALMVSLVTRVPAIFLAVFFIEIALWLALRRRAHRVSHEVEEPARELRVLAKVLARLEREHFQSAMLVDLQAKLCVGGARASRRIAALDRLIDWREIQHHQIYGLVVFPLMWWLHVACAIERWRDLWGRHVPHWIEAVGALEALCSISAYAYEHPEDVFPEIVDEGPAFEALHLGHPLLPGCVRNDISLGAEMRLLVVSGANMSGKSTFLRTVGITAKLAQIGAPVQAQALRISPFAIGATLRVQDSIRHGISHFYAEIQRLKQTMDLTAGPFPVLFLFDEILHGTNSHDRRIGAGAVVKALVERGAIGLVTTHDLAVTEIVDALMPRAANVHFTDTFANGQLVFDYRLQPGVVQAGNALSLMHSIGLEVRE